MATKRHKTHKISGRSFVTLSGSSDDQGGNMEATRVTVDEVRERMGRGEQFTFVDTRNPQAWGEAETKLPGAIRIPADEVEQHLAEIPPGHSVITYCT
jgi:rhodanese-related sulfurtransferase